MKAHDSSSSIHNNTFLRSFDTAARLLSLVIALFLFVAVVSLNPAFAGSDDTTLERADVAGHGNGDSVRDSDTDSDRDSDSDSDTDSDPVTLILFRDGFE